MAAPEYTRVQLNTLAGHEYRRVSKAPTRPATADEIPVIDLEGMWFYKNSSSSTQLPDTQGTSDAAKKRIAAAIRKAATGAGFFYVANSGIPDSVTDEAVAQAKRFFQQPLDDKMKVHSRIDPRGNGYSPIYSSFINRSETKDLKEGFNFRYLAEYDPMHQGSQAERDPAQSPGSAWTWEQKTKYLSGFNEATIAWWQNCLELSRGLVRLFALALELPETYFDDITTYPGSDGLFICYPGVGEKAAQESTAQGDDAKKDIDVGIGSHTDMQCFTLLWQDESGGLEVLLPKDGDGSNKQDDPVYEWVGATPHPRTLVVNIADFLQRLSNDRFRSTVHRVYNRKPGARYSMPFFFGFNYDAECAVVPTCVDEAHPAKYAPISCGKWRDERMNLARTVPRPAAAS
ncbi:uncharacterized protein SPSK_05299 [Sporothrix schenckii 1099-18]|uniref:Fe2OG dioxygenase domain-containing protein n=1 Tax=Sporothrix schenckii 1099-18 TaxID=1397361 RepID=A0A0F2LVF8_SPOSC|nr:uncharacterized protein SPSK_05299 [Sporothrix schenckii 1099-18]KJR80470.1 hypothetical protein SPSK_05299 [Sporothrix schenckii 1099-18]